MAEKGKDALASFDPYDVIGVITPGVVMAIAVSVEWPAFKALLGEKGFSVGDLGLFLLVAFVLGHIIQAIGNLIEVVLWFPGGLPTNWVRRADQTLITPGQRAKLQTLVSEMEGTAVDLTTIKRAPWRAITTRAYGRLKTNGRADRTDIANRTYSLCRGLAAAVVINLAWVVYAHLSARTVVALLVLAAVAALWRMRRAGMHYARALVLDFIDLGNGAPAPVPDAPKP